jgi:hypothetical protein
MDGPDGWLVGWLVGWLRICVGVSVHCLRWWVGGYCELNSRRRFGYCGCSKMLPVAAITMAVAEAVIY